MTLAEFLLARIAEDESTARALERLEFWPGPGPTVEEFENRLLAECEAKRRLVRMEQASVDRILAMPYVGHPDYRGEWRP